MLTPIFIDLFPELAIRILSYLSLPDIFACQRTHSALYKLIKDSTLVQYHIATLIAGVEDNPWSKVGVHERLERLVLREDGWAQHEFDFSRTVPVMHDHSGVYELTGGVYLLGNCSRHAIHYCTLPSKASDETKWSRIDVDASIIDMGLSIYEHDLIAVVTTTPHDNLQNIEIDLLGFSTGKRHPQARLPQLFVKESQWTHPSVSIGIAGDTLALIITYYDNPSNPDDDFYIFDWKAGVLKMHTTAPNNSYTDTLFLSPTLLLLPNTNAGTLELWDPAFTHPIGALGLPPLSDGWIFSDITCRCEPNPTTSGTPYSLHPFHAPPVDAIAIFNICVESIDGPPLESAFSMFVRRRALLCLQPAPRSDGTFDIIPWDMWGPRATRWMSGGTTRWITTTAGERAVMAAEGTGTAVVVDFHPARLRATRGRREKGELHAWVEEAKSVIHHPAFEGKFDSWLPHVTRLLTKVELYEGLLMDEERLIGLKMDDLGTRIMEIVVHHLRTKSPGDSGVVPREPSDVEVLEIRDLV